MENPPHSELYYDGNKAFMELYSALKEDMGADKAAEAVALMYKGCGYYGYVPPARG